MRVSTLSSWSSWRGRPLSTSLQPLGLQRPSCNEVLKGLPLQELHDDKVLSLMLSDLVDGADVRMIQGRGSARFTLEPFEGLMVTGQLLRQKLQGDLTTQGQVFGIVDHAHAAATELFENAVMGDGLASH